MIDDHTPFEAQKMPFARDRTVQAIIQPQGECKRMCSISSIDEGVATMMLLTPLTTAYAKQANIWPMHRYVYTSSMASNSEILVLRAATSLVRDSGTTSSQSSHIIFNCSQIDPYSGSICAQEDLTMCFQLIMYIAFSLYSLSIPLSNFVRYQNLVKDILYASRPYSHHAQQVDCCYTAFKQTFRNVG